MQKKKVAAALAAVELYLQQEADAAQAAAAVSLAASPVRDMSSEPGQWAQSGRLDMMSGRRLMQLRAFANAR